MSESLSLFDRIETSIVAVMTQAEAEAAEREIIVTGNRLRALLVEFYERRGWAALGYASWRAWAAVRLGEHERTAYKELTAGLVERELLPNWANGEAGTLPESHLRPLAPLRDDPPALRETWERANEIAEAEGRPRTAAHVTQAVQERTAPRPYAYTCPDCGDVFSTQVWHCQGCGSHYSADTPTCDECEAEPAAAAVLPAPIPMAVHFSSETPEWYTPAHIIERVQYLFGHIDLDPCSNSEDPALANVPARVHYAQPRNGLAESWRVEPFEDDHGEMSYAVRVYMNPPYGDEIGAWVDRLVSAYESGEITEGVALLPARVDTGWWAKLRGYAVCFVRGRLKFSGAENSAPFPSALVYLGRDIDGFLDAFGEVGEIRPAAMRRAA